MQDAFFLHTTKFKSRSVDRDQNGDDDDGGGGLLAK